MFLAAPGEVEQRRHRGLQLLALLERAAHLGDLPRRQKVAALAKQHLGLRAHRLAERGRGPRNEDNENDGDGSIHDSSARMDDSRLPTLLNGVTK